MAETAPPPISGGTMHTTRDGSTVVAADPDRDRLYFVDAVSMRHLHTRELRAGDEPGRVVEDAAGRIHVVLRGGRAIATLSRDAGSAITRREVCDVPRGISYDAARDLLHVACAEGKLVSLDPAPSGAVTRTLDVAPDLRDVLVRGDQIFVTRFRAAQLLVLNADGVVQETRTPASFASTESRTVFSPPTDSDCGKPITELTEVEARANVAWRAIDVPNVGVTVLHQRSRSEAIETTVGGYGATRKCGVGIVQTALTTGFDTQSAVTGSMVDLTLGVDIATDPAGERLAVVAPGNHGHLSQVRVIQLPELQNDFRSSIFNWSTSISAADGGQTMLSQERTTLDGDPPCIEGLQIFAEPGQATAASFVSSELLAIQEREPAAISFYELTHRALVTRVPIAGESRADTGHELFHMQTAAGLACASCHPEAGDDGHVWTFAEIGPRRTQNLRGGLLGTEPLHWNGDMQDFTMLVKEVFEGRMAGFATTPEQGDALAHWLDRQPALHTAPLNTAAAERGKRLFESQEVGCNQCHAGEHLTNNSTKNVGTGADLQVPSLKGIRYRAPFMHDGCAPTLSARFTDTTCGGGDDHGQTSQLTSEQILDLTAYLETL